MPQVPSYNTFQERQTPLPGVRQQSVATARDFSGDTSLGDLGQAAFATGGAMAKAVLQQAAEYNEATIKTFDVDYADRASKIMADYSTLSGKAAIDAQPEVRRQLDELNKEFSQRPENDVQRQMWGNVSATRTASALTHINNHAATQFKVFSADAADARAKLQAQQAIQFRDDNKLRAQAIQTGLAEVEERARIRGETSPEQLDLLRRSYTTDVTTQIVSSYIAENRSGAAKAYLDAHSGDVLPDRLDNLRASVAKATEADLAVTLQRAIEAMPGGFKAKYKALGDAFDSKGEIAGVKVTGELYKHVKAGLEHAEAKARSDSDRYEANLLGRAQDWIINNPGRPVTELPRDLYLGAMSKGHLASLVGFAASSGRAIDEVAAVTRRGALLRMSVEDPQGFAAMHMEKEMVLGIQGIKEMQNMQQSILSGKPTEFATDEKQISIAVGQLGFKGGSEEAAAFNAAAYDALRRERAASGKPFLNETERQKVIDRLIMEGKTSGAWFGTKFYKVQGTPEAAATFTPKIPDADAEAIRAKLRARMGTVLPDDVTIIYKAAKGLPLTPVQRARLNLLQRG